MCKINGRKLGELREIAGVSQRELAKKLGVHATTISHYECGETSPSSETLDKICFILKINRNEVEMHNVGFDFAVGESKTVKRERERMKKMGLSRFSTPMEVEEWLEERRTKSEEEEISEVNIALANSFGIGKKKYILINPTFIHIPEWQRDTDMAKTKEIAENFDESKFDPIKAYVSDGKLKVADGAHRVIAFVLNGEVKILVEILDCKEHDAVMTFLGQSAARKTMTINDMYRAGVKANIEDYINLKDFFESRNIQITADNDRIKNPIGLVRPSKTLIRMIRADKEMLGRIVNLIHELEWNGSEKNAYTIGNMQVLKKMYSQFGTDVEQKLLQKCSGASFYKSKVFPVKNTAEMFDILSEAIR